MNKQNNLKELNLFNNLAEQINWLTFSFVRILNIHEEKMFKKTPKTIGDPVQTTAN